MAFEFKFPDVGEGITEGELLSWKVKEGDAVAEDQTLAEVETDKAVVEIPSPRAGRIVKLHVDEGETIEVGHVLVTIEEGAGAAIGAPAAVAPAPVAAPTAPPAGAPAVGAPPPAPAAAAAPATAAAAALAPATPPPSEKAEFYTGSVVGRLEEAPEEEEPVLAPGTPGRAAGPAEAPPVPAGSEAGGGEIRVTAMPSIRALAKELGVDINRVRGTGPGGRILRQDVEDWAEAGTYGRETVEAPSIAVEEVDAG